MPSPRHLCRVAVPGPFFRTFTYSISEDCASLEPGRRVVVPFGQRSQVGFFVSRSDAAPDKKIKSVTSVLDPAPLLRPDVVNLCLWMADYYVANPADCLALALPAPLRSRASIKLKWGEAPAEFSSPVVQLMRKGKAVKKEELDFLKTKHRLSVAHLVALGAIQEVWPSVRGTASPRAFKYRVADDASTRWQEWQGRRKYTLAPFAGERSRAELVEQGWKPHHITSAIKADILAPIAVDDARRSLQMIPPRSEVKSHSLTRAQQDVVARLAQSIGAGFATFLLHGITGSGKTLVYCHTADSVIARGQTVLFLTPEIALAGTMLSYLRGYFGDQIAILHSGMGERARFEAWEAIRAGKYQIVVGPRSALFAPLDQLGLIVVDEEHDGSYKQDDPSPRFHGRDAAIMRARLCGIPVLLGSASPSVESYHQARSGKYTLLELRERPAGACLPLVRVVDLRHDRLGGDLPFMSYTLKKEVEARLSRDDQVILFLNRRGYASMVKCSSCGHVPNCPACEVHMTYHKAGGGRLACHYCGMVRNAYPVCDKCGGHTFIYLGAGTQRLEESIARLFPEGKPLRFDSDAASGEFGAHTMLTDFASGKYNLLLGTQMVTKGLDLPNVSLVGVLSADHGLDLPDFRASEKTFARLLQVAGRSGRAEKSGEVVIQTYDPDNPIIGFAARQDFVGFFESEIEMRRAHDFPPFARLANIEFSGQREEQVIREIAGFRRQLETRFTGCNLAAEILGPAPCPHSFVKGVHRRHLLVRTRKMTALSRLLIEWDATDARFGVPSAVKVRLDIDPVDLM